MFAEQHLREFGWKEEYLPTTYVIKPSPLKVIVINKLLSLLPILVKTTDYIVLSRNSCTCSTQHDMTTVRLAGLNS